MSYNVYIVDKKGKTLELEFFHNIRGGTYSVEGTNKAYLNITYNYSRFFYKLWEQGLNMLNSKNSKEVIPILKESIEKLGSKTTTNNYWESTAGNVGKALQDLLELCELYPEGTINVKH